MGRRFESTQRRWMVQHQRRPIDGLLRTASALAVRRKPTPQLQNRLVDIQQNLAASGSLSVTAVSRYYLFLTLFILLYPNTHSKWQWMNQKLTLLSFYSTNRPKRKGRASYRDEEVKEVFFFWNGWTTEEEEANRKEWQRRKRRLFSQSLLCGTDKKRPMKEKRGDPMELSTVVNAELLQWHQLVLRG